MDRLPWNGRNESNEPRKRTRMGESGRTESGRGP
jgi:hypothetical protein